MSITQSSEYVYAYKALSEIKYHQIGIFYVPKSKH